MEQLATPENDEGEVRGQEALALQDRISSGVEVIGGVATSTVVGLLCNSFKWSMCRRNI